MEDKNLLQRLSRISTRWSVVFQAHQGPEDEAAAARGQLLQRYHGAIYRYLLGAVRDADAAEDLAQDFALRFIEGRFKGADPDRGRFRDYLRTALIHLAGDYHKRKYAGPQLLRPDAPEPAVEDTAAAAADEEFLKVWREELLTRTWEALAQVEEQTGQPLHTILHFRAAHPEATSARMAEEIGGRLGKPLTAAGVRQTLHRARERFADLLLDEVGRSLQTENPNRLEQELIDLSLLPYCQDALERRLRGS